MSQNQEHVPRRLDRRGRPACHGPCPPGDGGGGKGLHGHRGDERPPASMDARATVFGEWDSRIGVTLEGQRTFFHLVPLPESRELGERLLRFTCRTERPSCVGSWHTLVRREQSAGLALVTSWSPISLLGSRATTGL